MCTILLPSGGYLIAVKYIISYQIILQNTNPYMFHVTVLLPPGGYPIAVKYIISYQIILQNTNPYMFHYCNFNQTECICWLEL